MATLRDCWLQYGQPLKINELRNAFFSKCGKLCHALLGENRLGPRGRLLEATELFDAFREIGTQGTASISAVAPGVAEALVATAAGLFAAIPAVIAYNYFLTRIRGTAFRLDSVTIELLASLPTTTSAASKTKPVPVGVQG